MVGNAKGVKQLVILSGKGGTGKTSLSAAMVSLVDSTNHNVQQVVVDADVDAANLSLVLDAKDTAPHEFWGGSLAEIDPERCMGCGSCEPVCRYDAVISGDIYRIDPIACDGCAACVYACPEKAIEMKPQKEGLWFRSQTPYGTLFHAELYPGKENSGKLVTLIKQNARLWAEDNHAELVIIDGPPGIGCPVISACAGTDMGLVVTEPSVAGIHDLKRILGTIQHFKVPAMVCINKADIYRPGVAEIKSYCEEQGIEYIGDIPYDDRIPRAMVKGNPITVEFPKAEASQAIRQICDRVIHRLFE